MVQSIRRCVLRVVLVGGLLVGGVVGAFVTEARAADRALLGRHVQSDSLRMGEAEPIAEVRIDADGDKVPDRVGDTVTVAGRVTAGRGRLALPPPEIAVLQDASGGLHLLLPAGFSVERGDSLRVRGVLDHTNGLTRLRVVQGRVVRAPVRVPDPLPLSVASADGERYEGRLVRVRGEVDVKNANEGGKYVVLKDRGEGSSAQVTIFVANRRLGQMRLDRFKEGGEVEVTGVLGQYNYSYQIEPRGAADLASIKSGIPYLWMGLLVLGGGGLGALGIWVLLRSAVRRRTQELEESRQKLREREQQLRGLANSIPGVVYQFYARPDGTTGNYFVSEHAETVLGIDPDPETFQERFIEHVPASHQEELRASIREAVEQRSAWRFEMPFETPDGERIWVLGTSTPEEREDELLFNGVLLDVTERRRREQVLEETNATLEAILENLPAGVLTEDASREIIASNSTFCELLGLEVSSDEMEGRDCEKAAEEAAALFADPDRFLERTETTLKRSTAISGEEFRLENGRILERDFVPYEVPDGEAALWLYQDVTEQRRRRRLLERQNDLFAKAQDMANVGAWEYDVQTDTLTWTEQVYEIHELPTETELTTEKGIGFYHPDDRPTIRAAFTQAVEEGEPFDEELRIVTAGGEERWVRARGEPQTEDGAVVRVRGTFRDVTERKRREQELKAAKEEAEGAARLKTAMLANMSHEIRTPLTSITGFAEVLKDDLEGRPEDFADRIYRSGERLMKTLDSVLQLSKLEAGTYDLEEESVRLGAVVEKTTDLLRRDAAAKSITLETSLCEETVEGTWNEAALNRVAENLLENAIKFTPEGGTVGVRVGQEGEEAVLEVEDTGVGISEEALPGVFEAFTQESEGLDREYEGSGLGLSIVKRLVEAQDGTISVETEKGEGTAFTIRLPLRRNGEAE